MRPKVSFPRTEKKPIITIYPLMIVQGLVYNYSLNFLLRALIYLFRITSITGLVLLYEYLLYRRTIITQMMFIKIVFILEIWLRDKQTLYIECGDRFEILLFKKYIISCLALLSLSEYWQRSISPSWDRTISWRSLLSRWSESAASLPASVPLHWLS